MTREELLKIAKPILFNTEMVQAILEGRKTVTRRVIKPQPPTQCKYSEELSNLFYAKFINLDGAIIHLAKKPYMQPNLVLEGGDILYVRETWQTGYKGNVDENGDGLLEYLYRANGDDISVGFSNGKWRPSIHMPKEAARIFLKVTDIRVERLQDITEEQAIKEGVGNLFIDHIAYSGEEKYNAPSKRETLAIEQFELLWNSTIKKQDLDRYGWEANPWVWVIEFERAEEE